MVDGALKSEGSLPTNKNKIAKGFQADGFCFLFLLFLFYFIKSACMS